MKIVCGSCSAKYSIADEKVQGKVFKIRCRKCSNVIVVKGTEDDASGASTAASYGGTASTPEWYVVIDGEQAGPLTPEDLESYYTNGQVTLESFIWRDGMADWTPLGQVEVFAHLAMGAGGYDDATSMVDSLSPASDYEDDATAVVDANTWRQQQDQHEAAEAAEAAAAAASVGAAHYAATDFGGFDEDPYADVTASTTDPYGASDPYGDGIGEATSDPYGSSDPYAGADPYAQQPEVQSGYNGLDAGFGSEPSDMYGGADGGYNAQASVGGDGGGLFSSFDADAGNDGGLAYQSFSGLDSLQASGVDLNSNQGGASINSSMGNNFDDANDLVGSRNENSVLFSLSSLQQVEAVKSPSSEDVPLTDGSGLIDIQSLASAHHSMAGSGSGAASSSSPFGGPSPSPSPETFSPATMSVPAIMPRGSHRDNKPLIIAVVALALLLGLGGVGAAAYVMTREPPKSETIIREVSGLTPEQQEQLEMLKKQNENTSLTKAQQAELIRIEAEKMVLEQKRANEEAAEQPEEVAPEEDKSGKGKSSRKTTPSRRDTAASSKQDDPEPPKREETKRVETKSGIDGILKNLDNKEEPQKASSDDKGSDDAAPSKATKKKLGRTDVQNTMRKYNGKVKVCSKSSNSGNLSGTVFVKFNIESSGGVSGADIINGDFKGTDVGKCVLSVVRGMKFPAAQEDTPISRYPFVL